MRLEDVVANSRVRGVHGHDAVEIVSTSWIGHDAITVVYRDTLGQPHERMLFRHDESSISIENRTRTWSFDADANLTRLAAEANRIRLAYLFDPHLAIHSSDVDPLPHQITAVYESMIPRQPLRFLLADDPGAGKTIMTGLFLKELFLRGDLDRCLIVCPGSLAEQWQDELYDKFGLNFQILTTDQVEASRSGNWFLEHNFALCRLDQLSRNETLQAHLEQTDWDLIVVDEAHKMSATWDGDDARKTQRYRLGEKLSKLCRHFLLLSATPHSGIEANFQLFLALLDGDRFAGRYRQTAHTQKASDLMRRMVKEDLMKMDGSKLFPERRAYTVTYELTADEALLYSEVTSYVRDEFNRAEKLEDGKRVGTVGFALTVLQRRLASSPEAIYQSLFRRHNKLTVRLNEARIARNATPTALDERLTQLAGDSEDPDDINDIDEGLATDFEEQENRLADQATAAVTINELQAEINHLAKLMELADHVRKSGADRKWDELSSLLQNRIPEIEANPAHRKLIIFTEHKDTLEYLRRRITNLLGGQEEKVVSITGGMTRDERRKVQERFTQDSRVEILLATDAAGEGINLQRAHLMVNYDLPWNPNRLEQRFGRIHRIGQREVCHLWNLVAAETREGAVYQALLQKLEQEREALGGKVFDVLGQLRFGKDKSLREMLVEAIRYGDDPVRKAELDQVVEGSVNREQLEKLIRQNALTQAEPSLDVQAVAEAMERANARRLQPHYIESFFKAAFELYGGQLKPREAGRWEITWVPTNVRERARAVGRGAVVLDRYERVTFDRSKRVLNGKPGAEFVAPGHPLLTALIDLILQQYSTLLKQGSVFVDPDPDASMRVLCVLENDVVDARLVNGQQQVVSKRMQFVEIAEDGAMQVGGYAPYLDYRAPTTEELQSIGELLESPWLQQDFPQQALVYAAQNLVPQHVQEVRERTERLVDRALEAVHQRLSTEITYWDTRLVDAMDSEAAGKRVRSSSELARTRRDDLMARLERRTAELALQKRISARTPIVTGAMLVLPANRLRNIEAAGTSPSPEARRRIESLAMQAVMEHERTLGNDPRDVSGQNVGYDVESRVPNSPPGSLRLIEVKGRAAGADTVTVTRNEILTALNAPEHWFLALVEIGENDSTELVYIQEPFRSIQEPDFRVASVNFRVNQLRSITHVG